VVPEKGPENGCGGGGGTIISSYRTLTILWYYIDSDPKINYLKLTLLVGRQEGHPARKKYGGMVEVGTG